jgi:hypothetical protein
MERLVARGWHNAVSPPLGLREAARTQIPGAHAPGFTIPPQFWGSETNTSVNRTGMIRLAVQAQLFTGPDSRCPPPLSLASSRLDATFRAGPDCSAPPVRTDLSS